jgi:hypothetical protein
LELSLRGLAATNNNTRSSLFRKTLLSNVRHSFHQIFADKTLQLLQSNDDEKILGFKARLLGNIMFIGELFYRYLLQNSIIISVFDMLLGVETQEDHLSRINDYTVEGAVALMEKIGSKLHEKLSSFSGDMDMDIDMKGKIIKTFARLKELTSDTSLPKLSGHVKKRINKFL